MAVAHLALDLGAGHQRGDRVDHDQVERAGADQHVGDLERLLTGVGLADQQRVGVDAERLGVVGVERVLGVDERHDAAGALGVGHRVQGDRRLAGGLRAVDLHHPAARQAAEAERDVEGDRAGRDDLERRPGLVAEAHHRALAELLLDLGERDVERLLAVSTSHVCPSSSGTRRPASLCLVFCLVSSSGQTLDRVTDSPSEVARSLWMTPDRGRLQTPSNPNTCSIPTTPTRRTNSVAPAPSFGHRDATCPSW